MTVTTDYFEALLKFFLRLGKTFSRKFPPKLGHFFSLEWSVFGQKWLKPVLLLIPARTTISTCYVRIWWKNIDFCTNGGVFPKIGDFRNFGPCEGHCTMKDLSDGANILHRNICVYILTILKISARSAT